MIKKSKMQHYHEALKNAKDACMVPTKAASSWKIEAKQMNFPEPHHKCKQLQQLFCNTRGENA